MAATKMTNAKEHSKAFQQFNNMTTWLMKLIATLKGSAVPKCQKPLLISLQIFSLRQCHAM